MFQHLLVMLGKEKGCTCLWLMNCGMLSICPPPPPPPLVWSCSPLILCNYFATQRRIIFANTLLCWDESPRCCAGLGCSWVVRLRWTELEMLPAAASVSAQCPLSQWCYRLLTSILLCFILLGEASAAVDKTILKWLDLNIYSIFCFWYSKKQHVLCSHRKRFVSNV